MINKYQQLIKTYEKIKLHGKFPAPQGYDSLLEKTYIRVGTLFRENGNLQNALSCFKEAKKINPYNTITYELSAKIYHTQKNYTAELDEWEYCLRLDINNKLVAKNVARLKEKIETNENSRMIP